MKIWARPATGIEFNAPKPLLISLNANPSPIEPGNRIPADVTYKIIKMHNNVSKYVSLPYVRQLQAYKFDHA